MPYLLKGKIYTKEGLKEIIPYLKKYKGYITTMSLSYIQPDFQEMQQMYTVEFSFPSEMKKQKFEKRLSRMKTLSFHKS